MKSQAKVGKLFAKDIADKGLLTKIYKELFKLSNKKMNNPTKKWAKDCSRHVIEGDTQVANKHVKRCHTAHVIREMQVRAAVRHHCTPVRTAKTQNSDFARGWRGCGATGALAHCWWECKTAQPLEKAVWRFFENKTYFYYMTQQSHSLVLLK